MKRRQDDTPDYDLPDGPLSSDERRRLRGLLEADRRARWFWATVRIWVIWLGAVAAALTAVKTWWGDLVKGFFR